MRPRGAISEHVQRIGEDLHIQIIMAFGTVFQWSDTYGNASRYWQDVWDWLRTQHRDICDHPDRDYPKDDGDMCMLTEIWDWQEERSVLTRRREK